MKIGILTSSRADFGVYIPLLKKLHEDPFFIVEIIVFGTHLSKKHGNTVEYIYSEGFKPNHKISTVPVSDSPNSISNSIGNTIAKFSEFWKANQYDLIFALGDRYEMFAAVVSSVPFNYKIAHLHGGETTLGAIDNVFRHSISLCSAMHFASTEMYKKRIIEIIGSGQQVYNVGALGIDNLKNMKLLSVKEFEKKYHIDLSIPSILITFHPETVSYKKNELYIIELIDALQYLKKYQLIITMPNADTKGNIIRRKLNKFIKQSENSRGIENFGSLGYLSCMKNCSFLLGNTSSGFVEASYFPKYVINLGDRQKGRIVTPNIISCKITKEDILEKIKIVESSEPFENSSIYGIGNTSQKIIKILKNENFI